jgi:excinuclease UvrABC ATPase subunit
MQTDVSNISVKKIIKRLMTMYQVHTQTQLGEIIGVKQNVISGWISRNSIDLQELIKNIDKVDLNWLIYGDEKKTSDFSQNSEKVAETKPTYEKIEDSLCQHLLEENKFLKEELKNKSKMIEHMIDTIEMYRKGQIVVISTKDS